MDDVRRKEPLQKFPVINQIEIHSNVSTLLSIIYIAIVKSSLNAEIE